MKKPTAQLNYQIINFVCSQPEIISALEVRDQHDLVMGTELTCQFLGKSKSDSNTTHYMILFIYRTKNNFREERDDLRIFLDVINDTPPRFSITSIHPF